MDIFQDSSSKSELMKRCSQCHRMLPYSEFHRRRHLVRSGRRAACKACTSKLKKSKGAKPLTEEERRNQRVRGATQRAVEKGELRPPEHCEFKGCKRTDIVPHHPRYDGPDPHLNVIWYCPPHHDFVHARRAKARTYPLFPDLEDD